MFMYDLLIMQFIISFIIFEGVIILLIGLILSGLIYLPISFGRSEIREKRILVFFIYFEIIHLLLACLLIYSSLFDEHSSSVFITAALLIIGASGAETAIFLALFIRFFRLTGSTSLLDFYWLKRKGQN